MKTLKTDEREHVADEAVHCANPPLTEAIQFAIALADEALREDADIEDVEVKVGLTLSLKWDGGEWTFDAEAKAERKKAIKAVPNYSRYNPNQPELDFAGGKR
ncbi:MAG: hypothetical protein RBU25_19920 [Lentisphaeria bacterium]|jgi:hypothetical protein|nr:hypothetical protein [Lentisphaeria bacterium]